MAIVAVYLIACACRATLPDLGWRLTSILFAIRALFVGLGFGASQLFVYFCINPPHFVRNPDTARIYMFAMVAVCVAVGEFLARKYLRSQKIFEKRKHIPWVF
jgi:hypothetical protein